VAPKARKRSPFADRELEKNAALFASLGDATRLRLVSRLLGEGPLSITCLSEGEPVSRQAITKHLGVLEDVGLVAGSWEGRARVFSLEARRLEVARGFLEMMAGRWEERIGRLRGMVEGGG